MGLNDQIADKLIGHTVDVLRFSETVRVDVLNTLQAMATDLEKQITAAKIANVDPNSYKLKRMETLLATARKTIATSYEKINKHTDDQLFEVAKLSGDQVVDSISSSLIKAGTAKTKAWETKHEAAANSYAVELNSYFSTSLTPNHWRALVKDTMVQGSPAKDWWAKQSVDTQNRFMSQIRIAVAAGETNDQIVKRIIGSEISTKVVELPDGTQRLIKVTTGGVLDTSKREATALVRTAVQTVANEAKMDVYEENEDILGGYQALVTLDTRTSEICRARSKCAWDFKGNPLPESPLKIPFPGPPPWHFNCRTILVPITKSWAQLATEAGADSEVVQKLQKAPNFEPTQSSMDGQVSGHLSYEDWLRKQSTERQVEVLGKAKYELWKTGKLTMADLVDTSGSPLTLEQLKAKLEQNSAPVSAKPEVLNTKQAGVTDENVTMFSNFVDPKEYPIAGNGQLPLASGALWNDLRSATYREMKLEGAKEGDFDPDDGIRMSHLGEMLKLANDPKLVMKQETTTYFGLPVELDKVKRDEKGNVRALGARSMAFDLSRAATYAQSGSVFEVKIPAGSRVMYEKVFDRAEAQVLPESKFKVTGTVDRVIDGKTVKVHQVTLVDDGTNYAKSLGSWKNELAKAAGKPPLFEESLLKPPAVVPAIAPPKVEPPPQPPSSSWSKLSHPLGSNPGGQYVDGSGQKWYVKFQDDAHLKNEMAANELYKLAGVNVADQQIVEIDGKRGVASKWLENTKGGKSEILKALDNGVAQGFGADAWLANWDAVGMEYDNIKVVNGKAYRIDLGGSLLFRAQGSPKGEAFTNEATEVKTLLSASKAPQASQIFSKMTTQQKIDSIDRVLAIKQSSITDVLQKHYQGQELAEINNKLILRRSSLAAERKALIDLQAKEAAKVKVNVSNPVKKTKTDVPLGVKPPPKEIAVVPTPSPVVPAQISTPATKITTGVPPASGVPGIGVKTPKQVRELVTGAPLSKQEQLLVSKIVDNRPRDPKTAAELMKTSSGLQLKSLLEKKGYKINEDGASFTHRSGVVLKCYTPSNVTPDAVIANSKKAKAGLSRDQVVAVQDYSSSDYVDMVEFERKGGKGFSASSSVRQKVADFNSAIEKIPDAKGQFFRGMRGLSDEDYSKYMQSAELELNSFQSFSYSNAVGHRFSTSQSSDVDSERFGRVVLQMKGNSAKSIYSMSSSMSEEEVIFKKKTKFKVTGRRLEMNLADFKRGDSPVLYIEGEEI